MADGGPASLDPAGSGRASPVARLVARRHAGTDRPQPLGGVLGRQVALRLGQQLVADHELAHVGPQQRRVEVGVDLPVRRSAPSPNGAWCQPIEYGNGR